MGGDGRQPPRRVLGAALALACVVAVVGTVAVLVSDRPAGDTAAPVPKGEPHGKRELDRLEGIPQRGTVLGSPDAPVTLVEYADFKCPYCRIFSLDVLPALIDGYVTHGLLKIDFRPQAFVADSRTPGDSRRAATMGLAAAEQNRFWQFSALFYANQQPEGTRYVSDGFLRWLGGAIPGLDVERALTARDGVTVAKQLDAAERQFYEIPGLGSTPSFLLGRSEGLLRAVRLPLDEKLFMQAIRRQLPR